MKISVTLLLFIILGMLTVKGQQTINNCPISITHNMQYLLYLPGEYHQDTLRDFPLLLFLHGGGESGNDIEKVKSHGPPKLVAEGKTFPCIILSPQNPHLKKFWDETSLISLLDTIQNTYRVDNKRIYLTGLSRGGYGAWQLAIQYPDRFAALIAISGVAPAPYAGWLGNMPVWVFHGEDDHTIPVAESDRMVEALRQNGNEVRYTRYAKTGHDAWTQTFNNPEVYEWLLTQHKD